VQELELGVAETGLCVLKLGFDAVDFVLGIYDALLQELNVSVRAVVFLILVIHLSEEWVAQQLGGAVSVVCVAFESGRLGVFGQIHGEGGLRGVEHDAF
jgi:hypothetical protein